MFFKEEAKYISNLVLLYENTKRVWEKIIETKEFDQEDITHDQTVLENLNIY